MLKHAQAWYTSSALTQLKELCIDMVRLLMHELKRGNVTCCHVIDVIISLDNRRLAQLMAVSEQNNSKYAIKLVKF